MARTLAKSAGPTAALVTRLGATAVAVVVVRSPTLVENVSSAPVHEHAAKVRRQLSISDAAVWDTAKQAASAEFVKQLT